MCPSPVPDVPLTSLLDSGSRGSDTHPGRNPVYPHRPWSPSSIPHFWESVWGSSRSGLDTTSEVGDLWVSPRFRKPGSETRGSNTNLTLVSPTLRDVGEGCLRGEGTPRESHPQGSPEQGLGGRTGVRASHDGDSEETRGSGRGRGVSEPGRDARTPVTGDRSVRDRRPTGDVTSSTTPPRSPLPGVDYRLASGGPTRHRDSGHS